MSRRHHYRRRVTAAANDLDMTTFLNLMVVLVPFLLITAVFSRITIVELTLPSSNSGAAASEPNFRVEVIVRDEGLEISNGRMVIASIPKLEDAYDLDTLSTLLLSLKRDHPEANAASVLLEPEIEYDHLIRVMDVVRSVDITGEVASDDEPEGEVRATRMALFVDISIGDAP
jgi:biopolymer transport protein ExbD